tara:strand:+ start:3516 stop:3956 length:441 start_codon:yes stop_codon:yes gene_type:complete
MSVKHKIIKLDSGEEIIALVHFEHWNEPNGYIRVEDSMKIVLMEQSNSILGRSTTTLALTKWLPYTDDIYATIPTSKLVTVVNASSNFIAYYKKIQKEFDDDFTEFNEDEDELSEIEKTYDEKNEDLSALSEVLQDIIKKGKRSLH